DRPVSQPRWIDNRSLMAHVAHGFTSTLVTIDRDGVVQTVAGLDVNPSAFAQSSTGALAYIGDTTLRAPELWLKMPNAAARPVTALNAAWSSIPVAAPEFVKYKSADGIEIEAALLKPAVATGSADAARLPFVLL